MTRRVTIGCAIAIAAGGCTITPEDPTSFHAGSSPAADDDDEPDASDDDGEAEQGSSGEPAPHDPTKPPPTDDGADDDGPGDEPMASDSGTDGGGVPPTDDDMGDSGDGDGGADPGAPAGGCGNDVVDAANEVCDGPDLGGASCEGFGFAGGALTCKPNCIWDLSDCTL